METLRAHKNLILTLLASFGIIGYLGEPERIRLFAGQIIISLIIGLIGLTYLKIATKKLESHTFKTLTSRGMVNYFTLAIPGICVAAPFLEEVMFRAPLLVLFDSPTAEFWLANICLSAYFGYTHHANIHLTTAELVKAEGQMGEEKSAAEKLKFAQEINAKKVKMRKMVHVIISGLIGVGLGYLVVDYQSLWIGVAAHSVWNLLAPFVIILCVLIAGLIVFLYAFLTGLVGRIIRPWRHRKT